MLQKHMLDDLHGVFRLALCEGLGFAGVLQRAQVCRAQLLQHFAELRGGGGTLLGFLRRRLRARRRLGRRRARLLRGRLQGGLGLGGGSIGLAGRQTAEIQNLVHAAILHLIHQAVVQGVHGEVGLRGHEHLIARFGHLIIVHTLLQDGAVEVDAISNLVVVVIGAELQQEKDILSQVGAFHGNLGQGIHCSGPDQGVLQNESVVDETNVLGRMRCARHLLTQKSQDARAEVGILTVLNELAKVKQTHLSGCWHLGDDQDQGIHQVLFDLSGAIFTQVGRQEGHQHLVLPRI
mmetsp:Transcript_9710/g.21643  ORF Transcript_9710/g.21643 Transcript_9710/m.21643 type:complete len:292 (-) Transcript_9710:1309-2184(-)